MSELVASLYRGITYKGREGHWAYMLHRVSGIGIFLFLLLHVFDIFLMSFGEEVFNAFLVFYHAPVFRVLIIGLVFGVLFHAFNGVRIIVVDFWPQMGRHQRLMFRIEMILVLIIFIPGAIQMLRPLFQP